MYVQGIGKSCTRRHLRETFAVFGEIEETKVFFREDKYVLDPDSRTRTRQPVCVCV